MERQGEETHLDTEEARGAETTGVMRWVLGISLLLAIGLLSAIWIFGAWTQDDVESQATVSGTETETGSSDTGDSDLGSIVSQDADEIRGVDEQDLPPGTIEN